MNSNVATDTVSNPERPTNTELQRWWLIAAWVAWIAIVVMALVIFIAIERFTLVGTGDFRETSQEDVIRLGTLLIILIPFGVAGAVIAWRKHNDWMALLVALTLITLPLSYTPTGEHAFLDTYPQWTIPLIVRSLVGEGTAPLLILLLVFPNGRFAPRWSGAVVSVAVVVIAGLGMLEGSETIADEIDFALYVGALFGVLAQVYRYRRVSGPAERQQTKWVVLGLTSYIAGFVIFIIGFLYLPQPSGTTGPVDAAWGTTFSALGSQADIAAYVAIFALQLMFPLSLAVAILRQRLWDIDVVLNRALVYGTLTAALAGTYFGGVVLLQMAFRGLTGQGNSGAIVISTLAIAALFMPLGRRIQDIIDMRFFRRRYDAARTLAAFSARMRDEVNVDRLTTELVGMVEETMQPAHASLWLRETPRGTASGNRAD